MAKKVLSIVIGTEYTRVCELSYRKHNKKKGIHVYQSISFSTPPNTIEDGCIKNMDAFGAELKCQLQKAGIKTDKVIFSVTSSKIANREVIMPPVKQKRIMDIIKTGASEYFPIDMKDYILSYLVLENGNSDRLKKRWNHKPGKQMRISVFAAPATLVDNYYSFAKQMHFDIIAIDYSGNSSYQMIKRQVNQGTNVFVQMNEQDTLISILRDEVLILQRTVGYGISALTDTVMEQDCLKVKSPEEALKLLQSQNLLLLEAERWKAEPFHSSRSEEEAAAASEEIRPIPVFSEADMVTGREAIRNIRDSLHFLTNSIARMLDYYKSSHKQIDIHAIYLTGAGVHVKGIENFFTTEIGITNHKLDKLNMVNAKKKDTNYRMNPSIYLTCIGAVLKPIDFVPLDIVIKRQKRNTLIGTVLFSAVCLTGTAGMMYGSYTDYLTAKQEWKNVTDELNSLPELSGTYQQYENTVKELEDLQNLQALTESHNDSIREVMEQLEKKLPTGTVTHSMEFGSNGVTMNVTSNISSAGPNALIAKVLKQMKDIEYFEDNVEISNISVEEEGGLSLVNYTISCTYSK